MGLIARVLEEHGIATVILNMLHDVVDTVRPPRTIMTNFEYGAPFGNPGDKDIQVKVLKRCLKQLEEEEEPGVAVKLPYK